MHIHFNNEKFTRVMETSQNWMQAKNDKTTLTGMLLDSENTNSTEDAKNPLKHKTGGICHRLNSMRSECMYTPIYTADRALSHAWSSNTCKYSHTLPIVTTEQPEYPQPVTTFPSDSIPHKMATSSFTFTQPLPYLEGHYGHHSHHIVFLVNLSTTIK